MNLNCKTDTFYSVVIGNLGEYVQPNFIQTRIYKNDENGNIKKTSKGTPLGRYADSTDYHNSTNGIRDLPVYSFATPADIYSSMTDDQQQACNAIKRFCNKFPTAFIWHNGLADKACQFNGLHIHLIMSTQGRLQELGPFRTMKHILYRYGMHVHQQKVRSLDAILAHLQEKPRELLGANNLILCSRLIKSNKNKILLYADINIDFNIDETDEKKAELDQGNNMSNLLQYNPEQAKTSTIADIIHKLAEQDQMPEGETFNAILRNKVPNVTKRLPVSHAASKVDVLKNFIIKYKKRSTD